MHTQEMTRAHPHTHQTPTSSSKEADTACHTGVKAQAQGGAGLSGLGLRLWIAVVLGMSCVPWTELGGEPVNTHRVICGCAWDALRL